MIKQCNSKAFCKSLAESIDKYIFSYGSEGPETNGLFWLLDSLILFRYYWLTFKVLWNHIVNFFGLDRICGRSIYLILKIFCFCRFALLKKRIHTYLINWSFFKGKKINVILLCRIKIVRWLSRHNLIWRHSVGWQDSQFLLVLSNRSSSCGQVIIL